MPKTTRYEDAGFYSIRLPIDWQAEKEQAQVLARGEDGVGELEILLESYGAEGPPDGGEAASLACKVRAQEYATRMNWPADTLNLFPFQGAGESIDSGFVFPTHAARVADVAVDDADHVIAVGHQLSEQLSQYRQNLHTSISR